MSTINILAIVNDGTLQSLRDLDSRHIPLLENILVLLASILPTDSSQSCALLLLLA